MITVDQKDLENLLRAFLEAPNKTRYVASQVLNLAAFGVRKGIPSTLDRVMTTRAKSLHRKALWATKASKTDSFLAMHSTVGSLNIERFSGWMEQEKGKPDPRKRRAALLARAKTPAKAIMQAARLRKGKDIEKPTEHPGANPNQRAIAMMQALSWRKYKKPFIVFGHNKLRDGLYKFEGSSKYKKKMRAGGQVRKMRSQKIRVLQMFGRSSQSIRKRPWMSPSVAKYFKTKDWTQPMEKLLLKHFFFIPKGGKR